MTEDEIFTEVAKAEHDYWGDSRNRFLQMIEEKHERDALSALRYAERKGMAKGKAEGIAETARMFLKMGLTVEQVAEGAGLSIEEVRRLEE
jgi:predicted transposase/invertase (TIGR01784 family)